MSGVEPRKHSLLRRWFGPSRAEIWRQLSEQIGATYVDGGFWKGSKVEARHQAWIVTLDSYTVTTGKVTIVYTRLRAPYVNPDGFRFTVYRRSFFTGIGKWFGMQDVEVGHPSFDDAFVIKGTSEPRLRDLFANARIRALIEAQPEIMFTVNDDEGWFGPAFPEGVDELAFTVGGLINDIERLKQLFDLFAETLDQLTRMGSAYERPPEVTL